MRAVAARKIVMSSVVGLLALTSGCAVLDVKLTSKPDVVHAGDPVKFTVTLFNRSRCPLDEPVAVLIPFIPAESFSRDVIGMIPEETPSEVKDFIRRIERFFDRLCAGEEPELPEIPDMTGSCGRGENNSIICDFTGPLSSGGNTSNMTFVGLGERLRCDLNQDTMSCRLQIEAPAAAEGGSEGLGNKDSLDCVDLGRFLDGGLSRIGTIAICFVGNFPHSIGDLPGLAYAEGSITLKARGVGYVRNIVFGIADDEDDLGICQGGDDQGDPCDPSDDDCYEGECVTGVCDGGARDGLGCDPAQTECPEGSCEPCDELVENGFLPIDCTTTLIEPDPAPLMSPMGLAALAVALLLLGTVWIQRRQRRQS